MIAKNFIEELKSRCPLEDVVSSYVTLKRAGSNYSGLCPFHSERTPSFTVFPATSSFYCFGCGAGGDVISFIMRSENLDYRDALEFLAKRAGIALPDDKSAGNTVPRKRLYEMNIEAAKYFRSSLFESESGAAGRDYLSRRGLSQSIIRRFGLGFANGNSGELRNHLLKKGFSDEEMILGFLCKRNSSNGSVYGVFRNRVMFPIIDAAGNIVAFGGRVLDSSIPKYLNSSDTPVFNKKRTLFAMNYAKASCSEQIILCEGYMDVIALHETGFENSVATLGTSITPDHARMLAKYTKKVIISYDSDEAGQRAADKAFRLLGEVGLDARILKVENAKDPDEYIRKFGRDKFAELLGRSRTRFDFVAENILSGHDLSNEEEKAKAAKKICEYISEMPSGVEREIYCAKLADMLNLGKENVKRDVERYRNRMIASKKKESHEKLINDTRGFSDRVNPDFAKKPLAARLEEAVLGMILTRIEYVNFAVDGAPLRSDDFPTKFGASLFEFIKDAASDSGFEFGQLSDAFTQEEVSRAMKIMLARQKLSDNGPEVFSENVRRMREQSANSGDAIDDIARLISQKRGGSAV